jgi:periplasmic mercuric ion binding protein
MKQVKLFLLAAFSLFSVSVFAHDRTDSIKVYGECGMCKKRIEKAATINGVKKVDWNVDSKMLVVTYNSEKTSLDAIQQKIAAVGHDTEKYTASNDVYNMLPGCCHYDRKPAGDGQNKPDASKEAPHNHN